MIYKNVEVKLFENDEYNNDDYRVIGKIGLVFMAKCRYGHVYALSSEEAIDGIKKLIDRNVK